MATLEGQLQLWKVMLAFVDSMVLGAAVELCIADTIHSRPQPLSLTQLATHLNLPASELSVLSRLLHLLTRKSIFSSTIEYVATGDTPFQLARGVDYKMFLEGDAKLNKAFTDAMGIMNGVMFGAVLAAYGEGFKVVGTLVEVGGCGKPRAEIIKLNSGVKAIHFDGDMFSGAILEADVVFIKGVLHNFVDEQAVKVLKNCRKSIAEKNGKLANVEAVLYHEEKGTLKDMKVAYDIVMFTNTHGKERTKEEWKKVLNLGGFPRCHFIRAPDIAFIIEAFPL